LTAVKQVLTDQEVTGPSILIKADLDKSIKKNLEKQNNLAQEKPTRIEDVTRTGKGLPSSLKAPKPKTLVQFMKENGGIRPDDPQVSDLRASLDKATFTVLNKKDGLSLDEMTIRVQEAGYFLDKSDLDYGIDGATPRDLLDLIDKESRGEVLYSRDQETQFRDYEKSQEDLKVLDRLGIDPTNMTEAELNQALQIAVDQEIMAQDVRLSESMEQTSDLTAQEFDNAKIEALENDYNMGNTKQEYEQSVLERAGIDDTFNLQTREAEIDTEIETLEFDAENTSNAANIDADDLAAFDANIKAADDLIAKADESYNTATDAAASCIMRNTK
jgi:hypothetical protein